MDTGDLKWACHICRRVRPDAKISVRSRDISGDQGFPPGTITHNVRYCNDSPDCEERSKTFSHLKGQASRVCEVLRVCGTCKHWKICPHTEGWRVRQPCSAEAVTAGMKWEPSEAADAENGGDH